MTRRLPLGVSIPVLYINPPCNGDAQLIEEVSRAGGMGIVDHVTAGPAGFQVASDVPHGVRVRLKDCARWADTPGVKLIIIPLEDAAELSALQEGGLHTFSMRVVAEVGSAGQAVAAERAGASALIARGNEGPGWVSEISGLVLLQEILKKSTLPVFLQGGIGLATAAGAGAAGATGVVLDMHLLLTEEAAIGEQLKRFYRSLSIPSTLLLADGSESPLRVYARVGTRIVRELRKQEDSLAPEEMESYRRRLASALCNPLHSPDGDEALLALSEDIVTAQRLAARYHTAAAVVAEFGQRMAAAHAEWPFHEGAPICRDHGTRYPIVQGPMAHVSDNPSFLAAVKEGGALPFLAMGNMPASIAREGMALAAEKTAGRFGVGLIGLEVNRKGYEAHLEIMKDNPPPFAILAAGGPELARRIEEIGTACYLHCPSPGILKEALKAGLRRFVFEGCESGGHIGTLGSLNLWTHNLYELEDAAADGLDLSEVAVLFAGGIATGRAAAFVAGMVAGMEGLKAGLQMGTAYLAAKETVSTCAITESYQKLTLESDRTVIIGRTVNTRARAASSPMAAQLIEWEQDRIRNAVPLRERKELYEKDNLGSLRLASKGCAIDADTATWDCPVFCDLTPEEQVQRGLYLMGQVVSLLHEPISVEQLHREILEEGRKVFEMKHAEVGAAGGRPEVSEEPEESPVEQVLGREPIAVVGIGLRLPGSDSPGTFWEQIITGRSGIVEMSNERWGKVDLYYDPDPSVPDRTYSRIGGIVQNFSFDPLTHRIPPTIAAKMDRCQQFAVTCVADALADAGLTPDTLKGKRVGIILGNSMGGENTDQYAWRMALPRSLSALKDSFTRLGIDTQTQQSLMADFSVRYLEDLPEITEDSLPGELPNIISGRVANVFNLEGPNFTVDAACASSIAAMMNAAAALREGRIDYAITGGVDAAMHPSSFVKFCKIGALSPDGSRPFDEGANGFVMGEGAGIMILKRLSDAVRDGDKVYGTVLEVGSSSDGRGKGITAPNAAGQERAMRSCFEGSALSPASISLIEAHGTSTAVGDKTELTVLDKFFREAGLPKGSVGIGSVKSQIGHLKAAAGAAGLIKTLLSLHHKTLPPTINVRRPNPCIDWETSPLALLTEPRPWEAPSGAPRRAGVSAFGFGGTNFHVVLQEHVPGLRVTTAVTKAEPVVEFAPPTWPRPTVMDTAGEAWVIGAESMEHLVKKVSGLLQELNPETASRLLALHRDEAPRLPLRCGFAAEDATSAVKKLELIREGLSDPRKMVAFPARGIAVTPDSGGRAGAGLAFLFPGQGSQYPFMLRDLAERYPVVAKTFAEADEILASLGLPTVTSTVFPATENGEDSLRTAIDAMKDTQLLQPMILTANTAMLRLLDQMGVQPAAAAGHSLGEYAACVAAGVFSFRDAVEAVAVRGREMARVSIADPGLMMSIPADARLVEEVLAEVDGYVVPANKNSPKQTVISGETEAVKKAGELFKERGLEGILLPVSAAFHSGVVAPAREPFMKTLERLTLHPPKVPVLSNVTGDFYPVGPAAPAQIRDLLGKQFAAPVEWVKTMRRLSGEGLRIFVECGPKRVMTNLILDTLGTDVLALPTNHPKKTGVMQLMETLAALAVEGVPVDFGERTASVPAKSGPAATPKRSYLRLVTPEPQRAAVPPVAAPKPGPALLEGLLDAEIRELAGKHEFKHYLELQGEPIRALIKSGYHTFVKTVLPLEQTVRQVEAEGMDFQPVVVSGIAAGLPSDVRFPFDREALDDLILGGNFIKKVPQGGRLSMLEKNVERLVKGPAGEADLEVVDDVSGVIQLAGYFDEQRIIEEYGLDEALIRAMDITTRLSIAAGIEALRDAGIPLMRQTRKTSTGHELPDAWALPPSMRQETGIIFASAFPGIASVVDEVTRETAARYGAGARKQLIEFYTGIVGRIRDDRERERITKWFSDEFNRLSPVDTEELYTFNRSFLLKVMTMAQGQLAQYLKAQGPNTHVDAACASTTQAVLMARDWIRTGQAKRVLVVGADDVAGKTLLPWVGSGFLAMGAATTTGTVSEAALPFDDRRHGLILGSAAVGFVLERKDLVGQRGMEAIASVEAGKTANSAYHGTRLDVDHIAGVMNEMISRWEKQSGLSRADLARDCFFMSHETYSPKRGGSSAAEVSALRRTFGDHVRCIPIANTKGFTGHTMGVGVEDVAALRCLQKGLIPPIPNLKQPDPEFADLNLSRGGRCDAHYALRLAAGFGSQIVMALYKVISREENRVTDLPGHRNWLREVTGYTDPVVSVENRTLKVTQRAGEQQIPEVATQTEPAPVRATVAAAASGSSGQIRDEIRTTILDLLSKKTGYPPDMLDTGLDLEADLGIDTVKQAEFISEVRDAFGIPRIEGLRIADFPTIEHIIIFAVQHRQAVAGEEEAIPEEAAAPPSTGGADPSDIKEKILALLSAKTGYPADMLDTELDLEADLGIDTVKQAEFISDVREAFGIPPIEGLKIADFPTINHIICFVVERMTESAQAVESPAEEEQAAAAPMTEGDVRLLEARLVYLPALEGISKPTVDEVLVAGGPADLVKEVETALRSAGYRSIVRITDAAVPKASAEKRIGVVNLFSIEDGMSPRKTFELCLSLATTFEQGPAFFVSAVSQDGAYGFENPTKDGYKAGIVAGATKSFAREYPDALVRVLDLHPGLGRHEQAGFVVRSLQEGFPLETAVGADGRLGAIRLVPHLEEIFEPGTRPGDVVLASGGAGGITAACIRRLAEQHPLTFVILDRTSLSNRSEQLASFGPAQWDEEKKRIVERMKREGSTPTPVMVERELGRLKAEADAFRNIRELKALGSEVILRSLDIRDGEAVDRAIKEAGELCGRIDVVIHAAGIDISRALKSKSIDQIENVVSVKVEGMLRILDALKRRELPPRRIVGFGSVSGRFGNLAQIDYSAANDGLAHMLRWADREMDAKASIIDWAPWSQIGMATRGSVQLALEAAGIDFVSPQQGIDFLFREVGRTSAAQEVMAAGRMGPFTPDAFGIPGAQPVADALFAGQEARIEIIIPGEYVKARVSLDPVHPLLDHHRIDRAAVLAGVGGLEIMRAAASLLDPDAARAHFADVHFRSALKIFKDEPFEAEVEVIRILEEAEGAASFKARISSWFVDREGRRIGASRLHHECRLVPASHETHVPDVATWWPQSVWVAQEDIYQVFFHGPGFRFLDSVHIEGNGKGIRFIYTDTAQRPSMFTDIVPGAVEAAFQAGAALGLESHGLMALPVAVDRVTVLSTASLPYEGVLIPVRGVIQEGPDARTALRFDGVVRDREGTTLLTLSGIELMELAPSTGFPRRVFEESLPLEETRAALEADAQGFIAEHLDGAEVAEHAGKTVPKRAEEWLAGRVAVKRTVQRILAAAGEAVPRARSIRVVQDHQGKPGVELLDRPGETLNTVSLSHSNGLVVAAASATGAFEGLGVDIEKVEARSDAWVKDYFTDDEIRQAGTTDRKWAELTKIWCLKEAALKALGTGLRFDLRDVAVASLDDSGRAVLELRNQAAQYIEQTHVTELEARVEQREGLAIARVVIRGLSATPGHKQG